MDNSSMISGEKIVYCVCPRCKTVRRKISGLFNIIKRGHERNGLARFLCLNCSRWFNERTGESMRWQERF